MDSLALSHPTDPRVCRVRLNFARQIHIYSQLHRLLYTGSCLLYWIHLVLRCHNNSHCHSSFNTPTQPSPKMPGLYFTSYYYNSEPHAHVSSSWSTITAEGGSTRLAQGGLEIPTRLKQYQSRTEMVNKAKEWISIMHKLSSSLLYHILMFNMLMSVHSPVLLPILRAKPPPFAHSPFLMLHIYSV